MTNVPLENPKLIKTYLQSQGAFVINLHGSVHAIGLPDLVACLHGRFVAVEVKRPGGKPRKLQLQILKKIRAAGGIALSAQSVSEVRTELFSQLPLTVTMLLK